MESISAGRYVSLDTLKYHTFDTKEALALDGYFRSFQVETRNIDIVPDRFTASSACLDESLIAFLPLP